MEQLNLWLFLTTSLVINAVPGPDVLYVISNHKYKGWPAALPSIAGLFAGYLFHVLITYIGVSAIIAGNPILFSAVKYLGSAYLIWMGVNIIIEVLKKHKKVTVDDEIDVDVNKSTVKYFSRGFIISALNPKVSIFFLSFLPQFIPKQEADSYLIIILGLIFCIGATLFNLLYCMLSSINYKGKVKYKIFDFLPGIILASVGVYTAF
ncbi:Leucine efflux protein [Pseudoalteromonas holothuriae]|uniref:Leucine efflux protein n=1 Tax=Pseudoalteromonas holothuriae TaxID=2963714 RepID=A0A9W4R2D4_9GAMM|nr:MULTISPECIES: LysE family translocator [unclassified Pseudoalteromonas]CAH9063860.1 Leucine efflux protein [Pseudoalteromonas sp. CIP111854]CAH9064577.1 Leucine efflux protein [Pseudoalteromonas sp. CIP111951]